MRVRKLQEIAEVRETWCAAIHGMPKSQTQLNDWTPKSSPWQEGDALLQGKTTGQGHQSAGCCRTSGDNAESPNLTVPLSVRKGCPGGSGVKVSACNAGDLGLILGLGRSPREGNGNPFQYSCLENSMDGGAWWATVLGAAKSQTRLSNFTFTFWVWGKGDWLTLSFSLTC